MLRLPRLALAPMAGVSDMAFRMVCRDMGAGLTYTEMVSSRGLCYNDKKTKVLLTLGPGEHPSSAQIFGNDPACMAEAAVIAAQISGADFIDINMGCPTPKIVTNGDGCALMRKPELAGRIIRAVADSSPVPVTVKLRSGWDKGSVNAEELAVIAEQSGASAVCVHGRTRTQMYSGTADWDIIARVKRAVSIPVIANGDVLDGPSASRMARRTGADCIMIGRAAFGYPWVFEQASAALAGLPEPEPPTLAQRFETARKQLYMAAGQKGERLAVLEARRHYAWYLRGIAHAGYYKRRITEADSLEDIEAITKGILRDL